MRAPIAVWLAFVLSTTFASVGFLLLEYEKEQAQDDKAPNLWRDQLQSADRATREQSAEALGLPGVDARTAVPALVEALKDRDPGVRVAAARALGKLGAEARPALPALSQALSDTEEVVLKEALQSIRRIEAAGRDASLPAGLP